MQVDRPKGWKWDKQISAIAIEDHRVNFCDGMFNLADRCARGL
jgi:hypothetical protein